MPRASFARIRNAVSLACATAAKLVLPDLRVCFEPDYYLDRNPDVRRSGLDPLAHFLLYGGREGREPHPLFDAAYYLAGNPDVAAAGSNPLIHFLRYGWKEGRRPNPLFDASFYKAHTPGLAAGINPFADYLERRRRGERPVAAERFALPASPRETVEVAVASPATVDVLIPVYLGLEETRRCVKSLLGASCRTPHEIVLINDRTPDRELHRYLHEVSAAYGRTLIENPENLGFAGSVNRGFALHPDRDVVLLNSDTEVANDWLDRLAAAAFAQPQTGTVTPFSNNATICSYPRLDEGNSLPCGVAELDSIFRQVNAGHRVSIPTAVGFCMYIRRDCLNDTGNFRPELFGKGYGEENDFCLRATDKGWSHVLAADVFVYHAGATSFASESAPRRHAAMKTLRRLYPKYERTIADHLQNDPTKPYRIAVSAARMRQSGKPVILAISHDLGGGVEQYVTELRELLAGDAEMLLLTPASCGAVILRNLDPLDDFRVVLDVEEDYPALVELLQRCGVTRLHVQHMQGHTLEVERLRQDLGVPMDFSAHDYYVICPQVTLTDAAGRYCGEPGGAGCNACLAARPPWPPLHGVSPIDSWRREHASLVTGADRVIAPSQDTADRLGRYFPEANIVVTAHTGSKTVASVQPGRLSADDPLVIAVLGILTPHKGLHRLRECARAAAKQKLPLRFVLAGYVDKPFAQKEPFEQTGRYRNEELPGLLRKLGAHAIWFPAQSPETFSYTLSACLAIGLPVIAPDLGAFAERLAGRDWTWIVPWDWDAGQMIEFFLSARKNHFLTGLSPAVVMAKRLEAGDGNFYPAEYLSCGKPAGFRE